MYSSLYTYTMLLFRTYYLALGDRLVQDMVLSSSEDIYYLYDHEIRSYVNGQDNGNQFADLVSLRKEEMEMSKDVVLPEVIYGDALPPVIVTSKDKLTGIPTSRGYYTGKVKVVRGIGDFNKLDHGDVLVIPFSDVGWIPLFAKAGAVIAESGGILSHSSIIAREYNIPAVVSVPGALSLDDGTLVSINGYKGEILVHDV
jgi:pyruvate,water dikinase